MIYKIHKVEEDGVVLLKLSGRFSSEDVAELDRQCEQPSGSPDLVLDLEEVKLVDQDVVRFLERCEANGARLQSCPPYIRQWITQERDRRS